MVLNRRSVERAQSLNREPSVKDPGEQFSFVDQVDNINGLAPSLAAECNGEGQDEIQVVSAPQSFDCCRAISPMSLRCTGHNTRHDHKNDARQVSRTDIQPEMFKRSFGGISFGSWHIRWSGTPARCGADGRKNPLMDP